MKIKSMRDAFWDQIYELAKKDKNIVIVSADFGAPALDKFRENLPEQFINVGISEQNAILVATGLALKGKKPIAYAITQFITLRCFEQIRIYPCGMNLPVTIVGVGAGACYWESGATHHCFEQLSIMRTLPNLRMLNCSDQEMAKQAADYYAQSTQPLFIQLDREVIHGHYVEHEPIDFTNGYKIHTSHPDNMVITTGNMFHEVSDIQQELKKEDIHFGVIDLFNFPAKHKLLTDDLTKVKHIITIEESCLEGGLGSHILEMASDVEFKGQIKRIALHTYQGNNGSYNYGGREAIRKEYGMGRDMIMQTLRNTFKESR